MSALTVQYSVGAAFSVSQAESIRTIAHDHTSLADLDDSETLYTADFTATAADQGVFIVVTTTGDTTSAHTVALSLMHTASHALAVTSGLIREDQTAAAPATTVTLDMGVAADRNCVLHLNPSALDSAGSALSKVFSLKAVGAGSLSNCVVRVSVFGYALRSQR